MLGAGDTAPDFQLEDVHGHRKSLGDFITNTGAGQINVTNTTGTLTVAGPKTLQRKARHCLHSGSSELLSSPNWRRHGRWRERRQIRGLGLSGARKKTSISTSTG